MCNFFKKCVISLGVRAEHGLFYMTPKKHLETNRQGGRHHEATEAEVG